MFPNTLWDVLPARLGAMRATPRLHPLELAVKPCRLAYAGGVTLRRITSQAAESGNAMLGDERGLMIASALIRAHDERGVVR